MPKILCKHEHHVTWITINNPQKRNAFDAEMSEAVISVLKTAVQEQQRAIVIHANIAQGVFSAGHDLNELQSTHQLTHDPMFEMFDCIQKTPVPVIAQVNGAVYAGSLHLLMICDLVYATNDAKVIMTANKMGVPFSLIHYQNWMSVMGIHKIKELFFTASDISADDAYNAGIYNAIFDSELTLSKHVHQVCDQIIQCSEEGIANSKFQLNKLANNVLIHYSDAVQIENARQMILSSESFQTRLESLITSIQHKRS